MKALWINFRGILLRDFTEVDRAAFIGYQTDPRYLQLYDFDDAIERPSRLFDLFVQWQSEQPRTKMQLGIFETAYDGLLGCGGLRKVDDYVAVLGIELAPSEWGRFRVALDASAALPDISLTSGKQRCRMHGGTNPGAPKDNRNAWKRVCRSANAIITARYLRMIAKLGPGDSCECPLTTQCCNEKKQFERRFGSEAALAHQFVRSAHGLLLHTPFAAALKCL